MPPLITFGLPAYNRPDYLRQALQSCLAQDYPNLEILVTDDASPQPVWPAIEDLKSDRWSFYRQPKNIGATAAFNYLINQAQGEIFILHQDDDQLHPQFARRAAEALQQHPDAVFYCGQMWRGREPLGIIGQDLSPVGGPWTPLDVRQESAQVISGLDGLLMMLFTLPFMHPALAMRKSVLGKIGGYFSEFMFASDNVTLGKMLLHGPALYDCRNSGFYRVHGTNVSTGIPVPRQYAYRRRVVEILLPELEKQFPGWPARLTALLKNLPRRARWKILAEAMEAGYPAALIAPVSQSISSKPGKASLDRLRARLTKARWSYQIQNFFSKS